MLIQLLVFFCSNPESFVGLTVFKDLTKSGIAIVNALLKLAENGECHDSLRKNNTATAWSSWRYVGHHVMTTVDTIMDQMVFFFSFS